ncbi:hypothetical protein EVAR_32240_1 [Eumeta japonica]|uniref:Uncharacterized protein n=1 Tax=Eumeta variegata TaxID=151549 RepID=A0A4C1YMX4_EUMVA|nr:hypothetical protein EVAR_32240_1 [Eumeta japonica]
MNRDRHCNRNRWKAALERYAGLPDRSDTEIGSENRTRIRTEKEARAEVKTGLGEGSRKRQDLNVLSVIFKELRQTSLQATKKQVVSAAHGHPQPQRNHLCISDLFSRNRISDIRGKGWGIEEGIEGMRWSSELIKSEEDDRGV